MRGPICAASLLLLAGLSPTLAHAAPPPGDAVRGLEVYEARCGGCHALDANRVGPAHRGVFGRRAGAAPDFDYSPALKRARFVWNTTTLDRWLQDPSAAVPGSRMGFRLSNAQERADVIAYLAANPSPARRSKP